MFADTIPPTAVVDAGQTYTNAVNVTVNITFSEVCDQDGGFVCPSTSSCDVSFESWPLVTTRVNWICSAYGWHLICGQHLLPRNWVFPHRLVIPLFLKAAAGLWSWGCCTINISGDWAWTCLLCHSHAVNSSSKWQSHHCNCKKSLCRYGWQSVWKERKL